MAKSCSIFWGEGLNKKEKNEHPFGFLYIVERVELFKKELKKKREGRHFKLRDVNEKP
jgi:hypothetical protein